MTVREDPVMDVLTLKVIVPVLSTLSMSRVFPEALAEWVDAVVWVVEKISTVYTK